jgi:hypothetical protein
MHLNHQSNMKRRVPVRLYRASSAMESKRASRDTCKRYPPSFASLAVDIICTTLRKQLVFIILFLPHLVRTRSALVRLLVRL